MIIDCCFSKSAYLEDHLLIFVTVTDNESRRQPACLEEWKTHKEENMNDSGSVMYINVCYVPCILL
jgi:hypothetical protein